MSRSVCFFLSPLSVPVAPVTPVTCQSSSALAICSASPRSLLKCNVSLQSRIFSGRRLDRTFDSQPHHHVPQQPVVTCGISELPSDDLPDSDTSLLQGLRLEVLKRGLAAPVLGSVPLLPELPPITFSEIHMAFSKYDGNQLAAKLNILFALGRENFDEKAALLTLLQRPNCLAAVSRRIDISQDVNLDRGNVLDQWDARELSLNAFFRSLADKQFAEFVETSESELGQLMVPHALASGFLSGLSHYDNLKGITVVSVIVATPTATDPMFGTSSFGILSESESDQLDEPNAGTGSMSESDWDRRLNQRLTWLGDVAGDSRFLPGFAMYWTTDSQEDVQVMFQGDGKLQGKRHVVWRSNQVPKKVPRS